jgi:hypothetical protein
MIINGEAYSFTWLQNHFGARYTSLSQGVLFLALAKVKTSVSEQKILHIDVTRH